MAEKLMIRFILILGINLFCACSHLHHSLCAILCSTGRSSIWLFPKHYFSCIQVKQYMDIKLEIVP